MALSLTSPARTTAGTSHPWLVRTSQHLGGKIVNSSVCMTWILILQLSSSFRTDDILSEIRKQPPTQSKKDRWRHNQLYRVHPAAMTGSAGWFDPFLCQFYFSADQEAFSETLQKHSLFWVTGRCGCAFALMSHTGTVIGGSWPCSGCRINSTT